MLPLVALHTPMPFIVVLIPFVVHVVVQSATLSSFVDEIEHVVS